MKRLAALIIAALVAAALAVTATGTSSQATKIFGSVGPGFSISLRDAAGNRITNLAPGSYELVVDDKATEHNFHLTGPGVNVSTEVDFVGQQTFQITLSEGTYNYICDPHATRMKGAFTVGTATNPPPPSPPASPQSPPAPVGAQLTLTVGPGFTITLRTKAGRAVRTLRPGGYVIVARDRSASHNAHILGAGVNKRTTVPFVGAVTWNVRLKSGTLRFLCDPHASTMKGSVKISR